MENKKFAWEVGVSEAVKMGVTEKTYHEMVEEIENSCKAGVALLLIDATWIAEKELGISDRLPLAIKDANESKRLTDDVIAVFKRIADERKDSIPAEDHKLLSDAFDKVARTFYYCETSYNQNDLDLFLSGKIKSMTYEEYLNWCKNTALKSSIEAYVKYMSEFNKLTA